MRPVLAGAPCFLRIRRSMKPSRHLPVSYTHLYSVCLGMGVSWKVALTAILCEGIIFIILSIFKFRETLVNSIPANLKYGITAGIGLFISIIGLKGAGVVVGSESTLDVYKRQL